MKGETHYDLIHKMNFILPILDILFVWYIIYTTFDALFHFRPVNYIIIFQYLAIATVLNIIWWKSSILGLNNKRRYTKEYTSGVEYARKIYYEKDLSASWNMIEKYHEFIKKDKNYALSCFELGFDEEWIKLHPKSSKKSSIYKNENGKQRIARFVKNS